MGDPYSFDELRRHIKGEILTDSVSRTLYSTDASVYYDVPLAIAIPKDATDISIIIEYANKNKLSLIPRGAGTSLAGQVVGNGLVVDVSRYMNRIIEINQTEKWAIVEPGVILDDLNREAAKVNLFFGPETSTSNRCTIGGMVGNNSCGSHSLIYGSTRDHLIEVTGFLGNSDEITFKPLQKWEFDKKCRLDNPEGEIYRLMREIYTNVPVRKNIRKEFPHPEIKRRNSGYALDVLLDCAPFNSTGNLFNLSKLIAGSEGTLLFITSVKLGLVPVPKPFKVLLCAHFNSLTKSLDANIEVLKHNPDAVELMDKNILDLTLDNQLQRTNRFFVNGDPAALLLIEFSGNTSEEAIFKAKKAAQILSEKAMGYAFPIVEGKEINKVWALRKAGLGVLSNMKGDAKPVTVIEDTAVRVNDLPEYVKAIEGMLLKYGKSCVYHAHVGTGELHIRPVLNLKDENDIKLFRIIGEETAAIVKSFGGALSGEHGDGRLRGEFIPLMAGDENYSLMKRVKKVFDPEGIFNPGKILETPPMDTSFRHIKVGHDNIPKPVFNWNNDGGLLRATERCSGSGDCLKSTLAGGTMCPSYMGTRQEIHSTRGRANALRVFLQGQSINNNLSVKDIRKVLDLCLSCKACKSECPSGVDMAMLKAEFLQHYYNKHGIEIKAWFFANISRVNQFLLPFAFIYNRLVGLKYFRHLLQYFTGISSERALPLLSRVGVEKWYRKNKNNITEFKNGRLLLFVDEFTNYYDGETGIKAVILLNKLGYYVEPAPVKESGRALISKGFVNSAKKLVKKNLKELLNKVNKSMPLVGIEPSAILTFRDEYPVLAGKKLANEAITISENTYTIEEFLYREMISGKITKESFTRESKNISFHAHCHQKSLSNTNIIKSVLSIPENYRVDEIRSGCCGMAGSFGYEVNHYNLSMKIGELSLFPEIRKTPQHTLLVAPGHSCRHQIKDGTKREAKHTVDVLFDALV